MTGRGEEDVTTDDDYMNPNIAKKVMRNLANLRVEGIPQDLEVSESNEGVRRSGRQRRQVVVAGTTAESSSKPKEDSDEDDAVLDEKGRTPIGDKMVDLCDCLQMECGGCHWPCSKCGSGKCGVECRQRRRYAYEYITFDGHDLKRSAPHPT